MERTVTKGLYAKEDTTASKKHRADSVWADITADILFFLAVTFSVCSMLSMPELFIFTLPGAAILFLRLFNKSRLRFMLSWAAILAAVIIISFVFGASLTEGLKTLGNRLFDLSESLQGYKYDRFETFISGESALQAAKLAAFILSCFLALGLVIAKGRVARLISASAVFGFIAFTFAYFGVIPGFIPVLLPAAALAFFTAQTMAKSFASALKAMCIIGAVFAATGLITFAAAPKENPAITEISEQLRDRLALRTVHYVNMNSGEDGSENENDPKEDESKDSKGEADDPGESGSLVNGGAILAIVITIAAILAILFIPAFFFDRVRKKKNANTAGMDSEDNATAIRAHFMYLMRWFKAKGIYKENEFYEDCIPVLEEKMSGEYAQKFARMLDLWKEATFSGRSQSNEARKEMADFVKESTEYMWENADFKEHMNLKYKYAL